MADAATISIIATMLPGEIAKTVVSMQSHRQVPLLVL